MSHLDSLEKVLKANGGTMSIDQWKEAMRVEDRELRKSDRKFRKQHILRTPRHMERMKVPAPETDWEAVKMGCSHA
mgnify:FL=1